MGRALLLCALVLACGCSASRAEWQAQAYGGTAYTHDGDLELKRPGTDVVIKDVSFDDESFKIPPYYGLRLVRWNSCKSCTGWSLEMTHPKAIADPNEVVEVVGTDGGGPAPSQVPLSRYMSFELSHGHNFVTLNYMRRWFPKGQRDDTFLGRIRPYVGLGAGLAVPHVEVLSRGVKTHEYQIAGPAVQGLAGVEYDIYGPWSAFAEYKLHYAHLDMDLKGGGTVTTDLWTHQLAFGIAFRF